MGLGHILVHIAIIGRRASHYPLEGGREALQGMIAEFSGDANQGIVGREEQMFCYLKMAGVDIFVDTLASLLAQEIHKISIAHTQWLGKAMGRDMATSKTIIARKEIVIHRSLYLLHQRMIDARATEMLTHIITAAIIEEYFYLFGKQDIGEIIQVPIQFCLDVIQATANDGFLSQGEVQRLLHMILEKGVSFLPRIYLLIPIAAGWHMDMRKANLIPRKTSLLLESLLQAILQPFATETKHFYLRTTSRLLHPIHILLALARTEEEHRGITEIATSDPRTHTALPALQHHHKALGQVGRVHLDKTGKTN